MKDALNGFGSIVFKEILHIRRDSTTLVFALIVPLIQLILFGFAIDYDVRHIRTMVVDLDRSRESRAYLQSLNNTQFLEIVGYLPSPQDAQQALRQGDARVVVIVPPDFSRRSGTAFPPAVRVLLDGSDSQVATPARLAFQSPPSARGGVEARLDVQFNPQARSQVYTIPGLVGIILQLVTVTLTSFSLVREREQGTMEQLSVSPVGLLGLMLGKIAPYAVLAFVEMLAVLWIANLVFDVHIAGSLLLLVLLTIPFILAALAMGLLISTAAKTQGQALQFTLLTLLPSILLSGYIAPRETLPVPLYLLSTIFPVTHFIQIIRGIGVRGAHFSEILAPTFALIVIAIVLIALSTLRTRKSNE